MKQFGRAMLTIVLAGRSRKPPLIFPDKEGSIMFSQGRLFVRSLYGRFVPLAPRGACPHSSNLEMRLNMHSSKRSSMLATHFLTVWTLVFLLGFAQAGLAQQNPSFKIFQNFIVTGDYITAGWQEGPNDGAGFATGNIMVPDVTTGTGKQPVQTGVVYSVPKGADIVAAYLYWGTVEGNQSAFAGQTAFFNTYKIQGTVLGNPNAPTSWSAGGCSGSANGSKTMRFYRADVRPYLPVDTATTNSDGTPNFSYGALTAAGTIPVKFADSGSNGNTAPFALGASLVVVYRQLAPAVPLTAISLYDGIIAPSNASQNVTQSLSGIYQAGLDNKPGFSLAAKLTQIVANGQPNKNEAVYLSSTTAQPLPSIYGGSTPPFPGIYGRWDNPTWNIGASGSVFGTNTNYVLAGDSQETTSIIPNKSNSGCVSWGAMILSSTVQDSDGDGLIDTWETNQGYTDVVSGNTVALTGADPHKPDIFVELDYLSNLDGGVAALPRHSHLPKYQALKNVGDLLLNQHGINIHFDVGSAYQGSTYIIPDGTGGNLVPESSVYCDGTKETSTTLCAFPNQPAIGWKGDFQAFQSTLGNFQAGREQSYHYIISGHSLGAPRSYWATLGAGLNDPTIPTVVSVVNQGNTATVTLQTPLPAPVDNLNNPTGGVIRPGDCPNAALTACSDLSAGRITIAGSVSPGTIAVLNPDGMTYSYPSQLNGTYSFNPKKVTTTTSGTVSTTTFTITTANVANGMYTFGNDPQMGVSYLGPTSTSGHSDFNGGGDSILTLGLWGADDVAGCDPNPADPNATVSTVFCDNGVGTISEQTGTLLHELGHSLALSHGGTYTDTDPSNPSELFYDLNCKPNFLSVMNYLFQVRGFADGSFDYSEQTLPNLNEASLSEVNGIGPATSLTRWYSNPNALDQQIQTASGGGHYATAHCDGTFKPASEPPAVRVDALPPAGGELDWNNDFILGDAVTATIDINNNGVWGDPDFLGFDDNNWLNLQQIGARGSAYGFSQSGGLQSKGGGLQSKGGGIDSDGGGLQSKGGGLQSKGGGLQSKGGGIEQDEDTAHSTVGPPSNLICTQPVTQRGTTYPGCTPGTTTPGYVETKAITLTWGFPGQVTQSNFGQIRAFNIFRAMDITGSVLTNAKSFVLLTTITPVAPAVTPVPDYVDTTVKMNHTYTYFATAVNKQGAQSSPSNYLVVTTATK